MSSAYRCIISHTYFIPYLSSAVHAGFPSPADDFLEGHLDLNEYLIHHPAATYYVRVKGESMINEGIHEGDYVVCEPRDQARNGEIVVALIDGEAATLKRFYNNDDGTVTLVPANQMFSPIRYDAKRVAIQGIYKGLFRLER